jgi:serine/threonine-protein kinase haspin
VNPNLPNLPTYAFHIDSYLTKKQHRDLHENNICVRSTIPNSTFATDVSHLKFGSSGLQVTLIDYGLSRACLESGEVIYNNLESDLALFHSESTGIAGIQFDTYRR